MSGLNSLSIPSNVRAVAAESDLAPFSELKGIVRVENHSGVSVQAAFDIAFQTARAASRFRGSFYDLSLKMVNARTKIDEELRYRALSAFCSGLDEILREEGLASHEATAKGLQPFEHPLFTYRVRVVERGCRRLFVGYFQLDTFVMAVSHARDTCAITTDQA